MDRIRNNYSRGSFKVTSNLEKRMISKSRWHGHVIRSHMTRKVVDLSSLPRAGSSARLTTKVLVDSGLKNSKLTIQMTQNRIFYTWRADFD